MPHLEHRDRIFFEVELQTWQRTSSGLLVVRIDVDVPALYDKPGSRLAPTLFTFMRQPVKRSGSVTDPDRFIKLTPDSFDTELHEAMTQRRIRDRYPFWAWTSAEDASAAPVGTSWTAILDHLALRVEEISLLREKFGWPKEGA